MQHNTLEYNTTQFIAKQIITIKDIITTCTTTKSNVRKGIAIQCNSM